MILKICDLTSGRRSVESTFKIKSQVYHNIGSLMLMPNNNPKILQISFMGSCEKRVTTRCKYNFIEQAEERAIVVFLENCSESRNRLIYLFKRMLPQLRNDDYQTIKIRQNTIRRTH